MSGEAYVTLATNDGYAVGALVLGHSLLSVGTSKSLCILISPNVSESVRAQLATVFHNVVVVNIMDSQDSAHLSLLKRPELGVTFTKIHCWTLTQYTKCVFLDADMLAVQNPDELFQHSELSAACDVGWPDCFNSGMFVFSPSNETYTKLLEHATKVGSFDGGDQGLLNTFFPNWSRISFLYNMVVSSTYTYLPAYKQFGSGVKLVHFLGIKKPWQHPYNPHTGQVSTAPGYEHMTNYLNAWWNIYTRLVHSALPSLDVQKAADTKAPFEIVSDQFLPQCKQLLGGLSKQAPLSPPTQFKSSNTAIQATVEEVKGVHPHTYSAVPTATPSIPIAVPSVPTTTAAPSVPTPTAAASVPTQSKSSDLLSQPTPEVVKSIDISTQATEVALKSTDCAIQAIAEEVVKSTDTDTKATVEEDELSAPMAGLQVAETMEEARGRWEKGQAEFSGRDSFANIQAYIDERLKQNK